MKQVLRKLLKRTIEGNTETNVFERLEQEVLTKDELREIEQLVCDDADSAYSSYGVMFDFDEDIAGIILDTLAEGLTDYLKNQDEEDKNECLEGILKKIEPLRAYNLDFEN